MLFLCARMPGYPGTHPGGFSAIRVPTSGQLSQGPEITDRENLQKKRGKNAHKFQEKNRSKNYGFLGNFGKFQESSKLFVFFL